MAWPYCTCTAPANKLAPDLLVRFYTASSGLCDDLSAWLTAHGVRCSVARAHTSVWAITVRRHAALRRLYGLLYPDGHAPCLARKRQAFEEWLAAPRFLGGQPGRRAD